MMLSAIPIVLNTNCWKRDEVFPLTTLWILAQARYYIRRIKSFHSYDWVLNTIPHSVWLSTPLISYGRYVQSLRKQSRQHWDCRSSKGHKMKASNEQNESFRINCFSVASKINSVLDNHLYPVRQKYLCCQGKQLLMLINSICFQANDFVKDYFLLGKQAEKYAQSP